MHRAHVQQRAALPRVHMTQRRAGKQESAVQVHAHDLAPVLQRQLVEGLDVLDTRIGEGDVEPAPGVHHLLNTGVHRLLVGDVHGQGQGLAAGVTDRRRRLFRGGTVQVGHRHPGAFAGVALGDRPADAATGPGDHRDALFKTHDYYSCFRGDAAGVLSAFRSRRRSAQRRN